MDMWIGISCLEYGLTMKKFKDSLKTSFSEQLMLQVYNFLHQLSLKHDQEEDFREEFRSDIVD